MIKTFTFQSESTGSIPGLEAKILNALWLKKPEH